MYMHQLEDLEVELDHIVFGINVYTRLRGIKCVRLSPRMGASIKDDCQYCCCQLNLKYMPLIQKSSNALIRNPMKHKYMCDPYIGATNINGTTYF